MINREDNSPSLKHPKVKTAVEFLDDIYDKGHTEEELRSYLVNRRELTQTQVEEAFRIHHVRMQKQQRARLEIQEREKITIDYTKVNVVSLQGADRRTAEWSLVKRNADRPGVAVVRHTGPAYLLTQNRLNGRRLLKDFLRTEYNYVGVLECLRNEYWQELCVLVDLKKMDWTRSDIQEIFHRIPELYDFHKVFYQNLTDTQNIIGYLFVRFFSYFKIYVEYVKDCSAMILKMRKYIHNRKLYRVLDQIQRKSRRPKDCLVDLLLVPLDRIMDYKDLLDKLYLWADKNQEVNYMNLGKASRRIGRIANYIEKYKGGILNGIEMNKVQQFLGRQCDILTAKRRIIRRGLMIRRTTTWPIRKKNYIFFLFSDVLLWTTRKGEFQNLACLRNCKVEPSDSKTCPEMKFKIISTGPGRYQKTLLLECKRRRQRCQWYTAVEEAIENAKELLMEESGIKNTVEEFDNFVANKQSESFFSRSTNVNNEIVEVVKHKDSRDESTVEDDDNSDTLGFHHRYNRSQNFPNAEFFEEIGPHDDIISVTSEDHEPYSMFSDTNYGDSMYKLFPNMLSSKSIKTRQEESKKTSKFSDVESCSKSSSAEPTGIRTRVIDGYLNNCLEESNEQNRMIDTSKSSDLLYSKRITSERRIFSEKETPTTPCSHIVSDMSIIRRRTDDLSINREVRKIVGDSSSFTIRLGNTIN